MLSARSKYMVHTLVAFYEFKCSLAVFPYLQKKKEGYLLLVHSQALKSRVRAAVLGSRHFCSSKDESQTK